MKYSKQLPQFLRKRCWGVYIEMNPKMRHFVYNNNFETFCKTFKNYNNDK